TAVLTSLLYASWSYTASESGRSASGLDRVGSATSGSLLSEPHCGADHDAKTEDPDEEGFRGGTEAAQAQPAGVAGGVHLLDVGDHVALVRRGEVVVVEDRHVLRAGEQCLVEMHGLDALQ